MPQIAQLSNSFVGADGLMGEGNFCGFVGRVHGFRGLINFGGA